MSEISKINTEQQSEAIDLLRIVSEHPNSRIDLNSLDVVELCTCLANILMATHRVAAMSVAAMQQDVEEVRENYSGYVSNLNNSFRDLRDFLKKIEKKLPNSEGGDDER